ncbi:MAG TPA: RHS repeat-associated core domain-containing protein, partial [Polyangia bacterium]|nr:RHS repeat-associated core domain-containing protein [Polyangia bacterium]
TDPTCPQVRLDTAYLYDTFGNIIATTDCANDFDSCAVGQPGPPDKRFRTLRTSYNPADFNSPSGPGLVSTLAYGGLKGRFPVKITNALGHTEYSAYDPIRGVLVQKTNPDGVHVCYGYTDLGRQTSVTERCGLYGNTPMTTTINQYRTTTADPVASRVVVVTTPPTGSTSWAYTDMLGRKIETRGRSFDGGFTQAKTTYGLENRIETTEPTSHVLGASAPFRSFQYDELNRVKSVTDGLGDIDGTGTWRSTTTTTTYLGLTTHSMRTRTNQDGFEETQEREERKNTLGKVAAVADSYCPWVDICPRMQYAYDADGNLTDTTDPVGNNIHLQYDTRGRKTLSTDPDLGTWTFQYNGFGDLTGQVDNKGQTIARTYDRLGRIRTKTDASGTSEWVYDVAPGGGTGQLAAVVGAPDSKLNAQCAIPYVDTTGGNRPGRWMVYTEFGELQDEYQCTDGETFVTSRQYDNIGRIGTVQYPDVNGSRLKVGYHYTSLGFLQFVADETNPSQSSLLWQATAMNAQGQVTDETTGTGVETISTRSPVTGWLLSSYSLAHADNEALVLGRSYRYDQLGNLTQRLQNETGDVGVESFTYDPLNRVRTARLQILSQQGYDATETYDYDNLGSITNKAGKVYTYGTCGAGPHAVCTVDGGTPYAYDLNGNMTSGNGNQVTYTARNKVKRIDGVAGAAAEFVYDADENRVVQEISSPSASNARTVYVGMSGTGKSVYERTTRDAGSTVEHVQFIYAGSAHNGSAFALRVVNNSQAAPTSTAMKYYHYDHLGSVIGMTDESGRVVRPEWGGANATVMGYDTWGARRGADWRPADPASFNPQPGHREFTGHETIPNVGLVNMNGRVYDPVVGRFLTPDPNIQFVADLQSFNRYSYVLNNPLRNTDPTGFFLGLHFGKWDILTGDFLRLRNQSFGQLMMEAFALGACATGAGCALAGLMVVAMNAALANAQGASWSQIAVTSAISMAVGGVGGVFVGAAGGGAVAQIIGGAISGGVTAAITTSIYGGDLGANVLQGAFSGASGAALNLAASKIAPVTQASAQEADGGEGGGNSRGPHKGYSSHDNVTPPQNSDYPGPLPQEYPNSCVASSFRDSIWLDSGQSIPEAQLRTEVGNSAGDEPVILKEKIPVLRNHGMSPTMMPPVQSVDDLIPIVQDSPALVGVKLGPGESQHRLIVLGTVVQEGERYFSVLDPLSQRPGSGIPLQSTSYTYQEFQTLFNNERPVVKLW